MRLVTVTGENGYIATNLRAYLESRGEYRVRMLNLRESSWKQQNLSGQDVLIHLAGIVHQQERKMDPSLYGRVNRDLTVELAQKAKREGVHHFIFFSTASVYGLDEGVITKETYPAPKNCYGWSKLQAEEALRPLHDETFTVTILRPPMVYGPHCKGNYQQLVKLAKILPVFADYPNQRSMISIDHLNAFVVRMIETGSGGIFFPQDAEYGCTCRMIRDLARANGRHMVLTKALNPAVSLLKRTTRAGKKAFGTLIYRESDPQICSF